MVESPSNSNLIRKKTRSIVWWKKNMGSKFSKIFENFEVEKYFFDRVNFDRKFWNTKLKGFLGCSFVWVRRINPVPRFFFDESGTFFFENFEKIFFIPGTWDLSRKFRRVLKRTPAKFQVIPMVCARVMAKKVQKKFHFPKVWSKVGDFWYL